MLSLFSGIYCTFCHFGSVKLQPATKGTRKAIKRYLETLLYLAILSFNFCWLPLTLPPLAQAFYFQVSTIVKYYFNAQGSTFQLDNELLGSTEYAKYSCLSFGFVCLLVLYFSCLSIVYLDQKLFQAKALCFSIHSVSSFSRWILNVFEFVIPKKRIFISFTCTFKLFVKYLV